MRKCVMLYFVCLTISTSGFCQDYELLLPNAQQKGVLILFPGFPETPAVVKQEFDIEEPAKGAGIAVALMQFNRRMWLEDEEKSKQESQMIV